MAKRPKVMLVLSESWTLLDPRDPKQLVDCSVIAERVGIDGVMIGEHPVMGSGSDSDGAFVNPREWVRAGNQPPEYPQPSNLVLLSAVAAATTRLRLLAASVITPLRHPLVLAKDLATLDLLSAGRLIVLPDVSWQRAEYEAVGVPFHRRGRILDEQLGIWRRLWTEGSPIAHGGEHFSFDDSYIEPGPYRPDGPVLWFGGRLNAPYALRRLAEYGSGYFPVGFLTPEALATTRAALDAAGRTADEVEIASFVYGGRFENPTSLLDLSESLQPVPGLFAAGVDTFIVKPSQYIDDLEQFESFCARLLGEVASLTAKPRS